MTLEAISLEEVDEIHKSKGKAVSAFAYIEVLISVFITAHYFGEKNKVFLEEVLEHEYFSFELKKRIFYKILKNHHPKLKFPKKELDRFQQLRNLIAHGAIAARARDGKLIPMFRHQGKDHAIEATFKEWERLLDIVEAATQTLPTLKLNPVAKST